MDRRQKAAKCDSYENVEEKEAATSGSFETLSSLEDTKMFVRSMLEPDINASLVPTLSGISTSVISTNIKGLFQQISTPETTLILWHVMNGVSSIRRYLQWKSGEFSDVVGTYLRQTPFATTNNVTKAGIRVWLPTIDEQIVVSPQFYTNTNFTIGRTVRGVITINSPQLSTTSTALSGTMASGNLTDTRFVSAFSVTDLTQQSVPVKDTISVVNASEGIVWVLGPDWQTDHRPLRVVNNVISIPPALMNASAEANGNTLQIFNVSGVKNETANALGSKPYLNSIWVSPYTGLSSTQFGTIFVNEIKNVIPIGIYDPPRLTLNVQLLQPNIRNQVVFLHQFSARNTSGSLSNIQVIDTHPIAQPIFNGPVLGGGGRTYTVSIGPGTITFTPSILFTADEILLFPITVPPVQVETFGFTNPANNGTFALSSIASGAPSQITVTTSTPGVADASANPGFILNKNFYAEFPMFTKVVSSPLMPNGYMWSGSLIILTSDPTVVGTSITSTTLLLEGVNSLMEGHLGPCRAAIIEGLNVGQTLTVDGTIQVEAQLSSDIANVIRGNLSTYMPTEIITVMSNLYNDAAFSMKRIWKRNQFNNYNSDKDVEEYFRVYEQTNRRKRRRMIE